MTKTFDPQNILSFYREAEKLKTVLRHSFLSSGRQESVAEHTWMMLLLAMTLMPKIEKPLDQVKVLKMIVIHDLGEAVTRDMPVWEGAKDRRKKIELERSAMEQILSSLDSNTKHELLNLWEEYETRESFEARFVKVIDTLDVIAQHNSADIATWDENDYLWQLSPVQDSFFDFDPLVRKIKKAIDTWSIEKVEQAYALDKLDQAALKKRRC